jgi:hypothetical protein
VQRAAGAGGGRGAIAADARAVFEVKPRTFHLHHTQKKQQQKKKKNSRGEKKRAKKTKLK